MKSFILTITLLLSYAMVKDIAIATDFNKIEDDVYKTIEDKYGYYLDGGTLNLKEFNKNGTFLIFEISPDYDIKMNKYLKIFKYNNNIILNKMNVKDNIFYIDMKEMQFLPDISKDNIAEFVFNQNKQNDFCKIEIYKEHYIKFYTKKCENRFKKMLIMTSVKK